MIKLPQRLPDPFTRMVEADGRLSKEWYQYFREMDFAVRALIAASEDHETRINELENP